MDAAGMMKRRSASMVEGGNDRCEDSGSKQYDGMCRCSLAVVALRSKTNTNPGRWFLRCPLWKNKNQDCKYFQWIDELEEQDMVEEVECSWNHKPKLSLGGKLKQKSTRKLSESVEYEDIDPMVLPVLTKELKEKLRRIEILLIMMCIGVAIGVFINFFALFKN
ncbi:uncharacterized protein LOC107611423 [Arachis ipaensis]|uniref:GRF-type domain-containing protein n=1 Tax=Arachis hypogaea TaxID=3818 RepID=A0A444XZR8_ARAHY|nr:uncharacterized protein LOC107611423 [Arachis ipaensis]XP_025670496.1 uncharacterized protein LOC112770339 [Arachis hypogaea]RYQ95149.1 hypothetical protein Ahy_B08g090202 [Arachis hypogaea]